MHVKYIPKHFCSPPSGLSAMVVNTRHFSGLKPLTEKVRQNPDARRISCPTGSWSYDSLNSYFLVMIPKTCAKTSKVFAILIFFLYTPLQIKSKMHRTNRKTNFFTSF